VQERTAELSLALATLERAKTELVQSEKLASLGQLVAGVAHELNTPLGNALTSTSTIRDLSERFALQLKSGALKKSELEAFIAQCVEGAHLAERSMHRASALVQSFKQVAIDQSSERKRPFDLDAAVSEVVDTLRPNLKHQPWKIVVDIPKDLRMDSYPGPLGQIVMNLVMNAALHAFEGREEGTITLGGQDNGDGTLTLTCFDNGQGISTENQGRVFDPFFTTKLGQGGSGLGLSIVHRIATQILQGQISVTSEVGVGTCFSLRLPLKVIEPDTSEQV
jgi:signal transduction histidine kinase